MAEREIKVNIGGDTSGLDRALSKGQRNLLKFAKVGAAALAATGVAMIGLTRASLANIDTLAKNARSLGLTTSALQKMTMVAGEAGVEAGQLSSMLGLMQRNIIELGDGTAAQVDAFARLGLSMRDLQGLTPDEQFRRIAESLNQIEDPAVKTATAMDIFGRSGRGAINMLEGYSAKVEEAAEFNRRFNIEVSEVDAQNIEQANDAWARVGMALRGVGNQLATWVAPAIIKVSDLLLRGIETVMKFGDAFRIIALQVNLAGIKMEEFFLRAIGKMAYEFTEFTWTVAEGLNNLFGTDLTGMMGGADGTTITERLNRSLIETQDEAKAAREAIDVLMGRRPGMTEGGGDLREGGGLLPPDDDDIAGGQIAPGVGGGAAVTNQMAERLEALQTGLMTEQETVAAWYEESRGVLDDALAQELLTREGYADAVERLEEEHQKRLQSIREMGNKWGVQAALSGGAEILGAMGQMSEKALKASKVFAAAEALVSTYQGAAAELKKGTFGFASAAAVIAKGIGFVAAIKGVNASGGGSSGGDAGSSGATASAQQQQPATTFAFTLQNDSAGFGESFVRQMIEQINSAQRDGGRIQAVLT